MANIKYSHFSLSTKNIPWDDNYNFAVHITDRDAFDRYLELIDLENVSGEMASVSFPRIDSLNASMVLWPEAFSSKLSLSDLLNSTYCKVTDFLDDGSQREQYYFVVASQSLSFDKVKLTLVLDVFASFNWFVSGAPLVERAFIDRYQLSSDGKRIKAIQVESDGSPMWIQSESWEGGIGRDARIPASVASTVGKHWEYQRPYGVGSVTDLEDSRPIKGWLYIFFTPPGDRDYFLPGFWILGSYYKLCCAVMPVTSTGDFSLRSYAYAWTAGAPVNPPSSGIQKLLGVIYNLENISGINVISVRFSPDLITLNGAKIGMAAYEVAGDSADIPDFKGERVIDFSQSYQALIDSGYYPCQTTLKLNGGNVFLLMYTGAPLNRVVDAGEGMQLRFFGESFRSPARQSWGLSVDEWPIHWGAALSELSEASAGDAWSWEPKLLKLPYISLAVESKAIQAPLDFSPIWALNQNESQSSVDCSFCWEIAISPDSSNVLFWLDDTATDYYHNSPLRNIGWTVYYGLDMPVLNDQYTGYVTSNKNYWWQGFMNPAIGSAVGGVGGAAGRVADAQAAARVAGTTATAGQLGLAAGMPLVKAGLDVAFSGVNMALNISNMKATPDSYKGSQINGNNFAFNYAWNGLDNNLSNEFLDTFILVESLPISALKQFGTYFSRYGYSLNRPLAFSDWFRRSEFNFIKTAQEVSDLISADVPLSFNIRKQMSNALLSGVTFLEQDGEGLGSYEKINWEKTIKEAMEK